MEPIFENLPEIVLDLIINKCDNEMKNNLMAASKKLQNYIGGDRKFCKKNSINSMIVL
jgi:hypothetical protein